MKNRPFNRFIGEERSILEQDLNITFLEKAFVRNILQKLSAMAYMIAHF
ncbi:hypothetical protein CZ787_00030 [Halomonas citrativorans]|uniref:Uncharacterized protein n=1 Tax=Halomonas citrativorans TaxID=2742612 RepID=A0A1R4HMK9_9GAMM|nr:hypothetical protein CZ787_00030 [Halomonas citrativorans]